MNQAVSTANWGESPDFSLRPIFSNYCRDLPGDIARQAVFVIAIRPVEDAREHHEKTVVGCEGGACAIGSAP